MTIEVGSKIYKHETFIKQLGWLVFGRKTRTQHYEANTVMTKNKDICGAFNVSCHDTFKILCPFRDVS